MSFHEKVLEIKNKVLNSPEYSKPINDLEKRAKQNSIEYEKSEINQER